MSNRSKARQLIAQMQRAAHPAGLIKLDLKGELGREIRAAPVLAALKRRPRASVQLTINSTGGSVSEARRIYEGLRAHQGQISAQVGAECCSAAVLILLGADNRSANEKSRFLLHSVAWPAPISGRWTAAEHRRRARDLATLDEDLATVISSRTGQPHAWAKLAMAAETWLDAREAQRRNLVQSIRPHVKVERLGAVQALALRIASGQTVDTMLPPPARRIHERHERG